jgi:adenylylsulfate kinase-like enzyme
MIGLDIKYDKPQKPSLVVKCKKNIKPKKISDKILKMLNG